MDGPIQYLRHSETHERRDGDTLVMRNINESGEETCIRENTSTVQIGVPHRQTHHISFGNQTRQGRMPYFISHMWMELGILYFPMIFP